MGLLILHCDVLKEMSHGFLVMDAPYGLTHHDTDVHRLDLVALEFLHLVRNSVGDHHLKNKAT